MRLVRLYAGKPYFEVPIAGFTLTPETVRFMQFPAARLRTTTLMTDTFGDKDITVTEVTTTGATAGNYRVTLDFVLPKRRLGQLLVPINWLPNCLYRVLAKPSDHIVAYFENTAGLVEGVDEVYTSSKIVVQEIGASALRTAAQITTANTGAV